MRVGKYNNVLYHFIELECDSKLPSYKGAYLGTLLKAVVKSIAVAT